jgi:GTP-binding protein
MIYLGEQKCLLHSFTLVYDIGMTSKIQYEHASFLLSAANLHQLPADRGIEVAFAGRSNAGKSSALNAITQIKGLAKTSKTPGRTQLINLFRLDDERRLVDLPGYGYAKVPLDVKMRWQKTLGDYLEQRECLKGLILLMDIRHPLKDLDQQLLQWAIAGQLSVHILLTKADKLTRNNTLTTLRQTQKTLADYGEAVTVQAFSVEQPPTILAVRHQLDLWFS